MEISGRRPNIEQLAAKKDIRGLIKTLKYRRDPSVRGQAIEALGDIGRPAVKPLIEALKDKDWDVRGGAARALGNIGHAAAVEPLTEALLKDEAEDVRWAAAEALGEIGDAVAVEPLIEALKDEAGVVRLGVAWALGKIGDAAAVEPLIEALKDGYRHVQMMMAPPQRGKYGVVRDRATRALVAIGQPAVESLIEALKDRDADVRWAAAEALGEIGDTRAVEPLIEVSLKDKDVTVRNKAVGALGKIGQPAIESLRLRRMNMSLFERVQCKLLRR